MNRNNCVKLSRFVACVLIASLAMAGPFVAQAAPRGKKEVKPPQPIEVVADEMYFSGTTGELFGRGNVVVTHGDSRIYADIIRGNDKQTEIWVDKLTGVNYVFHASGYAGGLTPLLDAQGRVMVSEIPEE